MTGGLATVDFKRFARDGIAVMSFVDALQLFDTAMIVDEPLAPPAHIDFAAEWRTKNETKTRCA